MTLSSLPELTQCLKADFGLQPVTASEIEFYLIGSDASAALPALWEEIKAENLPIFKIEKEKGREQHEVALIPADPLKTAQDTKSLRSIIEHKAKAHGLEASFLARPFEGEPGSGLHIHVHLEQFIPSPSGGGLGWGQMDTNEAKLCLPPSLPPTGGGVYRNVFYKDDTRISDALKFSIGGLLATMQDNMKIFAPSPESYQRFVAGANAPLTVSWGANNRTTAIRLPDAPHDNKRIEYRVAGADADPEQVITAILEGIHYGLKNRTEPGPQIYGDASLEMYGLRPLSPYTARR